MSRLPVAGLLVGYSLVFAMAKTRCSMTLDEHSKRPSLFQVSRRLLVGERMAIAMALLKPNAKAKSLTRCTTRSTRPVQDFVHINQTARISYLFIIWNNTESILIAPH